jgi:hypothetical protein
MIEDNTFNKIVVSKHSRNGSVNKANLSQNQLRSHCVSVRLNDESNALNEKRGDRRKGEWLRLSSLKSFLLQFQQSILKPGNH